MEPPIPAKPDSAKHSDAEEGEISVDKSGEKPENEDREKEGESKMQQEGVGSTSVPPTPVPASTPTYTPARTSTSTSTRTSTPTRASSPPPNPTLAPVAMSEKVTRLEKVRQFGSSQVRLKPALPVEQEANEQKNLKIQNKSSLGAPSPLPKVRSFGRWRV